MLNTKWEANKMLDTKLDAISDYLCDNGFDICDNCGQLTDEDEMMHAYAYNGYEHWGEPLHSECLVCYENR